MRKSVHQSYAESSRDLDRIRSKDFSSYNNLAASLRDRRSTSDLNHSHSYANSYSSPFNSQSKTPKYLSSYLHSSGRDLDNISGVRDGSPGVSYRTFEASPTTDRTYKQSEYEVLSKKSTSSIVSSFHELQLKLKNLERQRLEAVEENEELKQKVSQKKREIILWKNKNEFSVTDNMLMARGKHDRCKQDCQELEVKIKSQDEIYKSTLKGIKSQEDLLSSLMSDIEVESKSKIHSLERRKKVLLDEQQAIEERVRALQRRLDDMLSSVADESRNKTLSLEKELSDVQLNNQRTYHKIESLKRYMEFIIEINGDLCETLISREESKANILRLAEKYTPPRYAWPKTAQPQQNVEDILEAVNGAATAAALEKQMQRGKSPIALKKLAKSILPKRQRSASDSGIMNHGIKARSKSPGEVLERRAAEAIAKATTAASIMSSRYQRSTTPITPRSRSRSQSAFIPSSSSRESKEFNRIARQSAGLI